ncbi:hypothetical protein AADR41_21435 [Streptomyces sp. CLV115]|uniref:DUF7878 domain-containing protein n=1 Tax=Streptomyces sp. CLV115 TaxID=3138502 RepID=UPI00313B791E
MLLLDIDAELSIWEQGREVWSEEAFPVAELAYHLALWLQSPAAGHEDFELDSMQAEEGLIRIAGSDEGRGIGSILTPEVIDADTRLVVVVGQPRRRTPRAGSPATTKDTTTTDGTYRRTPTAHSAAWTATHLPH